MSRQTLWVLGVLALLILPASPVGAEGTAADLAAAGEWKRAAKAWQREMVALASAPALDSEAAVVAEALVLRAVIEAGRGKDRHADWYWWSAAIFGKRPELSELSTIHRDAGTALAGMVQPAPPKPKTTRPAHPVAMRSKTERRPSPSKLKRAACEGQVGWASVTVQRDESGHYRAPRALAMQPITVRPLCALALFEEYRDTRTPGVTGAVTTLSHELGSPPE